MNMEELDLFLAENKVVRHGVFRDDNGQEITDEGELEPLIEMAYRSVRQMLERAEPR